VSRENGVGCGFVKCKRTPQKKKEAKGSLNLPTKKKQKAKVFKSYRKKDGRGGGGGKQEFAGIKVGGGPPGFGEYQDEDGRIGKEGDILECTA